MPGGGRKKAFSGKQKKQQLQVKREKQQTKDFAVSPPARECGTSNAAEDYRSVPTKSNDNRVQLRNEFTSVEDASSFGSKFFEVRPPKTKSDVGIGRYALMFRKETKEELNRQKKEGRKEIHPVLEEYLECNIEDFFTPELDFPIRPPWNYDFTREQLERNEYRYFHEYLQKIDERFQRADLSYFELNLETWRQLWRVLEMSDIVLCVVDMRYPPLLFPPKLYNYVCSELHKHLILVLNKVDICPAPLVLAWKEYFKNKYPGLEVLCFTSYPSYNLHGTESANSLKGRRKKGRMKMASEGAFELYKVCEDIVHGEVDLTSWKSKILEEMNAAVESEDDEVVKIDQVLKEKVDTGFYDFKRFNGGMLTIGCIGQPNVGKSSLINALMGRKVVSVSRTPGHTKHFQTIFLTPNVRLCDCPGLIFPSKIPKSLQVLCGSFPIAQLREPYSTIKYLAERLDLPKILRISHPEGESEWCACDIADGWAKKRGYYTAKAARLDTYRGANHILRLALEGRLCLCLYPPEYCAKKEEWKDDPRLPPILKIQARSQELPSQLFQNTDSTEDEEDYGEETVGDAEDSELEDAGGQRGEQSVQSLLDAKSKNLPSRKTSNVAVKNKFAMLLDDDDDNDVE